MTPLIGDPLLDFSFPVNEKTMLSTCTTHALVQPQNKTLHLTMIKKYSIYHVQIDRSFLKRKIAPNVSAYYFFINHFKTPPRQNKLVIYEYCKISKKKKSSKQPDIVRTIVTKSSNSQLKNTLAIWLIRFTLENDHKNIQKMITDLSDYSKVKKCPTLNLVDYEIHSLANWVKSQTKYPSKCKGEIISRPQWHRCNWWRLR